MLETMTIRCDQCGHENNPLYRFCGMCGSPLAAPAESRPMPSFNPARPLPRNDPPRPARPAPPPQEAWPVSGPSFLGLADEPAAPSRNVDYLLEDDDRPRRTYGRAFFVLLILAGFGALLYYHWKGEGVSVSLAQLWDKVNPQIVDQPCSNELLDRRRTADDSNLLVASSSIGLGQRVLDAFGRVAVRGRTCACP